MTPPRMMAQGPTGPAGGSPIAQNPPDDAKIIQAVTQLLTQALDLISQIQGPQQAETPATGAEQYGAAFNEAASR